MKKVASAVKHFLALAVLGLAFWPFCRRYLFASAPSGNDFYVGLNYLVFFNKHLAWPPAGWENFWFSGVPITKSYPWFHFYMMQPLTLLFGTTGAMEIYLIATFFLFFVFAYLLFWRLSKNRIFSLLLTLALFNSRGVFNALPRNGFVAAAATQVFLPLVAYLIVLFYQRRNKKFLVGAGLLTGLAILGHPPTGIIWALILGLLILFFWRDEKTKFWSKEKISFCLIFGLTASLVASSSLFQIISFLFDKEATGGCLATTCWGDYPLRFGDLNVLLYFLPAFLALMGFFLKVFKKKVDFRLGWAFLMPLFFVILFLVAARIDFVGTITQVLWPERVTWTICVILGAIAAVFFGGLFQNIKRLPQIVIGLVLSGIISFLLVGWPKWLALDSSLEFSGMGAWPEKTYTYATDKYKTAEIEAVLPSWLKKDDINYRLDSMNYMFNFWWSLAIDVPNSRGYVHYFKKNQGFWYGWLTAGVTDFWGEKISRPTEISQNTARFLIDWFAFRYLEDSNRLIGIDNPYSDFILEQPMSDKHEKIGPLSYYRIAEDKTSPIVKASNAKTMLVVGLKETLVYDNLMKPLAAENLNSQFLIPIRGPDTLDELKKYKLADFDLVFLNDYRYEDYRSWNILADYVKAGGKLFIETGTQVRESDSKTLPEGETEFPIVFPFKTAKRESLGTQWQLKIGSHPIFQDVDFDKFGPLLYEEAPWKVSFVPLASHLKEGAEVLLSQKGYPVLVTWKLGKGEVLWSGINLPYHFLYYDQPMEAKFFKNILSFCLEGLPNGEVDFGFERKRPEKVKITGHDFTGVVFKEFFEPGWQARVNGQKVSVYPAGPDFMYVRIPKNMAEKLEVEFSFRGSAPDWFFFLLNLAATGLILGYLLTGQSPTFSFLTSAKKKINGWWAKEEE